MSRGERRGGELPGRRYVFGAAAVTAVLMLTGCGSSGGGGHPATPSDGSSGDTTAKASRDAGPVCAGTAPADGVHVLRGGGFRLPGGGVQYTDGTADGTTRTATLRDGASFLDGQSSRKVSPGARITLAGHPYTVAQICSYRVVLAPRDAAVRAQLAAAPASMKPAGGKADDGLCFTTNAAVRAAAAAGFPAKGTPWTLTADSGRQALPTGLSVAVYSVDTGAGTAYLGAACAAVSVAVYKDAVPGDTVEFGGVTFTVASVAKAAVRLTRTS